MQVSFTFHYELCVLAIVFSLCLRFSYHKISIYLYEYTLKIAKCLSVVVVVTYLALPSYIAVVEGLGKGQKFVLCQEEANPRIK